MFIYSMRKKIKIDPTSHQLRFPSLGKNGSKDVKYLVIHCDGCVGKSRSNILALLCEEFLDPKPHKFAFNVCGKCDVGVYLNCFNCNLF